MTPLLRTCTICGEKVFLADCIGRQCKVCSARRAHQRNKAKYVGGRAYRETLEPPPPALEEPARDRGPERGR